MDLFSSSKQQSGSSDEQIEELLVKLTKGDVDAMGPLYDMTSTSVYAFALSMLKNSFDAEEVMHDCYVKLFLAAKSYSPQGKPMAYILSIVRNACINRLNEQKRTVPMSNDEPWETLLKVEEHPNNLLVAEGMALLKEDEQQIVLLHAISGFKHREIAAFMHLPLSTVLSKYTRSVRKLKKHFMERGGY
jgi:RNA polymerase sigma-70 factor (ECF subfamily)